jgi:hypothetical protein
MEGLVRLVPHGAFEDRQVLAGPGNRIDAACTFVVLVDDDP